MAINEKYKLPEETGTETADMGTGTASGYVNPYAGQLDDLYKSITERQPFQYDVNGDVMYQNLRDQYITGGQMAMMDTMGQAAQLTGGYGNSYAQGVGQQAYQGYLRGLNDQIPDLYNMALQNYIQQGDAMMQQYGMLQDMAADDYGKWIDQRNYDYQVSQDEADRAYRDQMDAREMAMAMLEAGTMPSEEMLAAAGLTGEFVTALYPDLATNAGGSSGSNGEIGIDMTTKWWEETDAAGNNGWLACGDGIKWQSSTQGRNWVTSGFYDLVATALDSGKSMDEVSNALTNMGLSQSSIGYLEMMYNDSKSSG